MEVTTENTAPAPGVEGRVVRAILADPARSEAVRAWAHEGPPPAASREPARPPFGATYECESCCDGPATSRTDTDGAAGRYRRRCRFTCLKRDPHPRHVAMSLGCARSRLRSQKSAMERGWPDAAAEVQLARRGATRGEGPLYAGILSRQSRLLARSRRKRAPKVKPARSEISGEDGGTAPWRRDPSE